MVYFENGGSDDMKINLLTCDIDKFSYNFDETYDKYKSEILYDNKPYKWCRIFSDKKDVSRTWLDSCELELVYNNNINKEMAQMAVKQFNKGTGLTKDGSRRDASAYEEQIELRVCDEQTIKRLINNIDDIVDRW